MFCRCENVSGRRAEHPHLPRLHGASRACCRCRTGPRSRSRSWSASRSARGSPSARSSTARTTSIPTRPKAYQISQYDEPLCVGGSLDVLEARRRPRRCASCARTSRRTPPRRSTPAAARAHRRLDRLRRRLQPLRHAAARDRDRAGPPHAPRQRAAFLTLLKATIQAIGVSDCDMEKGSLRCDANVSVRRPGRVRAPAQGRAQEHELVPFPRARHRGRAAPPGRRSTRAAAASRCRRCTTTRSTTS